jgi:hypothetical protein
MPQDVNIRTAGTVIGSALYDDRLPLVQPRNFAKVAPHVVENLQLQPSTGQFQPGTTAVWKIRRLGDHVTRIKLVATARELATVLTAVQAIPQAASYVRYPDRAALVFVKEVRIRYNHTRLQTIRPLENQVYIEHWLDQDERVTADLYTLSGMTDAQRIAAAAQPQKWQLNLYTAWSQQDPSNAPFVDGLSNELEIEVDFESAVNFLQTDAASVGTVIPADSASSPSWFTDTCLQVEYLHATEKKRQESVQLYAEPDGLRYFFNEFQYYQDLIPGTTVLSSGGTISSIIKGNISQPCQTLFVVLRWQNDVSRQVAGANGDRGRDISNFGGWYNAGGLGVNGSTRIFTHATIKSGNNIVFEQMPVEEFFWIDRSRYFKGFPGTAILVFNFSRAPTVSNAFLGGVDFSVLVCDLFGGNTVTHCVQDNPTLQLTINAGSGFATVNACATSDIGGNSDLLVDYIASTANFIDISGHDVQRPFN